LNILVKNTSLYTLGTIIPQAAGFILLPIYTRYLSPADYGIVNSMAVIGALISIFFSLCLERSMFRLYYDFNSDKEKKEFMGTLIIAIFIIATTFLILLFLLNKYVGLLYKAIPFYPFYVYTILASFIGIFSIIPKQYLMLKGQAGFFVTLSIAQFILNAGLILWYITVKLDGSLGYLKGNLFSQIILLPVFIILSIKFTTLKFKYDFFKNALFYSLPLIPSIMTGWVLNLSDRVFIERYFNLTDVGLYSLGYKIAGLVGLFTGSFAIAYTPIFFKLANSPDQDKAKETLYKYNHLYLLFVILSCFIISFFSKEVIGIFLDVRYHSSWIFVPLISISLLFSQAAMITSNSFQQSKKLKVNMYFSMIIALLSITLNFILIPIWGPIGATFTSIISMYFGFLISYYYTKKHCYFISINWKQIITIIVLLTIIFILFHYIFNFNLIISIIIKLVFLGILATFLINKYYSQVRTIFLNK